MKTVKKRISRLTGLLIMAAMLIGCGDWIANSQASAQRHRRRVPPPSSRDDSNRRDSYRVPHGTQMKVRLDDEIDSKSARDGDRFRATVLSPGNLADSTIEGYVSRVKQSGRVKGETSLALVFDRIRFPNGQTSTMRGDVVKVYGESSVKEVDEEGNVKSGSRGSSTAKRTIGGGAAGAIIGGIIGGGKGAAIGAGIGAGAGAGSNVIRGSNRVKLESGTEVLIKAR